MALIESEPVSALACCHGYEVEAEDGPVGVVETPLFPPDCDEPDFLVVRVHVRGRLFPRFPIVPVSLVSEVEPGVRLVRVRGSARSVAQLPEKLPLAAHVA